MIEGREKSQFLHLDTDGELLEAYICPPNCRAKVKYLRITNSGGNINVLFDVYKSSSTSRFSLLADKALTSTESVHFQEVYFVLEAGDKLEVTATGTTPSVDIISTIEEQFIANQGL